LQPILCVGETLKERDAGEEFGTVAAQLDGGLTSLSQDDALKLVIAYEPVWAIGTGRTATPAVAEQMHKFIRGKLRDRFGDSGDTVRIQYGGSVKPDNATALMAEPNIDGALVGGASLKADDFLQIVKYRQP
jgi:triosephosphate isomerase